MVTVTKADVTAVAPEFSQVAEPTVNIFIDYARDFVCEGKWGSPEKAKQAIVWMTAHMMKQIGLGDGDDSSGSTTGPVTMEKVGDLQRSYGQFTLQGGSQQDQLLAQTKYGQMFLMLKRTVPTTPLVV